MHLSIASVLLASPALFSALVSAQTYSDCNPMLKSGCPANPALSGTYSHTYGNEAPGFRYLSGKNMIKYGGSDGAHFRVEKSGDSPTIVSNSYIMYGKFQVTMKAAPGAGIVSSIVLQSEDLDEIDWEWLGGMPNEAQSNYFGKGNTETYDRGAIHPIDSQAQFHTYGLDWTASKLDWTIDGKIIRTLTPAMVKGDFYPQTPMAARIGIWSGGDPANEAGVIQWSGGPTSYKGGPYDMIVQKIYMQDYSTGKEYVYTDKTGSAASIKAVNGQVGAGPQQGSGNADSQSSSGSYNAPSNTGRQVSSTSKSEPTQAGGSGSNTDSSESTPNSASQPPSPSSPAGANYIATGGSTAGGTAGSTAGGTAGSTAGSGNTGAPTNAASRMAVTAAGMVVSAAGLIAGWIL